MTDFFFSDSFRTLGFVTFFVTFFHPSDAFMSLPAVLELSGPHHRQRQGIQEGSPDGAESRGNARQRRGPGVAKKDKQGEFIYK